MAFGTSHPGISNTRGLSPKPGRSEEFVQSGACTNHLVKAGPAGITGESGPQPRPFRVSGARYPERCARSCGGQSKSRLGTS